MQEHRWLQYVPGGLEARVVTDRMICPDASIDNEIMPMLPRSTPGEGYPVLVCAVQVPGQTRQLSIDGTAIPLPVEHPQRIMLLGDTGCRLKGATVQDCNDPVAWPFKDGAQFAAGENPDLVIHVGDYHYRETPCPSGRKGCLDSPYGDNWEVWQADFFRPAGALLLAAPWVVVRGNHEECQRGGRGWARILDPYPWNSDDGCLPAREPFQIDLGGVTLAVLDVSTAEENSIDPARVPDFASQYHALGAIKGPVWIAQHRPIWAVEETEPEISGNNRTLAAAADGNLPSAIQLILSGHHHAVEVISYQEDLPVQLVTGNGGDELSMNVPPDYSGMAIDGIHVKNGKAVTGIFGYSMLERDPERAAVWQFTSFDYHGNLLLTCRLEGRTAICS